MKLQVIKATSIDTFIDNNFKLNTKMMPVVSY